jgi:hypothetical protein
LLRSFSGQRAEPERAGSALLLRFSGLVCFLLRIRPVDLIPSPFIPSFQIRIPIPGNRGNRLEFRHVRLRLLHHDRAEQLPFRPRFVRLPKGRAHDRDLVVVAAVGSATWSNPVIAWIRWRLEIIRSH